MMDLLCLVGVLFYILIEKIIVIGKLALCAYGGITLIKKLKERNSLKVTKD